MKRFIALILVLVVLGSLAKKAKEELQENDRKCYFLRKQK